MTDDGQHLNLYMVSNERAVMRKVLATGMSIWIAPGEKKKKKNGIVFPIAMSDRSDQRRGNNQEGQTRPNGQNRMNMMLEEQSEHVEVIGMLGKKPVKIDLNQQEDLDIVTSMIFEPSFNAFVYEVSIPISLIFGETEPTKNLMVGFETGRSESQSSSTSAGRGGGGRGGSARSGGGGRGGRGGGMRGSGQGGSRPDMSVEVTWTKYEMN